MPTSSSDYLFSFSSIVSADSLKRVNLLVELPFLVELDTFLLRTRLTFISKLVTSYSSMITSL